MQSQRFTRYLLAHVVRYNVVVLCMQDKKRARQGLHTVGEK